MWAVAHAIRGKRVASALSLVVFPGSARILEIMAREGLLADLLAAGAIVSEPTCGSCAGIGHVPATGTRSLRAFNRNFPGRSGTRDDAIYLCSPVTAAVSSLHGVITDPRKAGAAADRHYPASLAASVAGLVPPVSAEEGLTTEVFKGPNIKEVPRGRPPEDTFSARVVIKLGDKVSTDDISPSGTETLMFRMNVPAISEYCFRNVDPDFVARAKAAGAGVIVGGDLYGQGSSREAAVLSPLHLGVRAVLAKTFARIHRANLINWGIAPLEFDDTADYGPITRDATLRFEGLRTALAEGRRMTVVDNTSGRRFSVRCVVTPRERDILLAGGLLAQTAAEGKR
jgi:aconitate hydratase